MSKLAVVKIISLLLGIGIVICLFWMFVYILRQADTKKTFFSTPENRSDLSVLIKSDENLKDFKVKNNKIYLWLLSSLGERIIVIDEQNGQTLLTLNLSKGED